MNLANGESSEAVPALMGRAGSACALDLYAGHVPNAGIGSGPRCMDLLRSAVRCIVETCAADLDAVWAGA